MGERIKARVSEIRDEAEEVKTFRFVPINGEKIDFIPGQFVMLHANISGEEVTRSYSISSSPLDGNYIELTLELTKGGKLTPFFHEKVKVGDEFEVTEPKGHFTYEEGTADELVLIAGGSGVVPFRCIIRYCTQKKLDTKITLIYSAKTEDRIIFREELDSLTKENPNMEIIYTLTRQKKNWNGRTGRVDKQLLEENFSPEKMFYLCGPIPFILDLSKNLKELGADRTRIKRDVWGA